MERETDKVYIRTLLRMFSEAGLQEVLQQFGEKDVEIENPRDLLFTEEETRLLAAFSNGLQEKGCTCKFEEGYTIAQAIEASRRLNSWVDEIENAKVDGRELTTFEKYVYAYEIVTDFVYNEEKEADDWRQSRFTVQVLSGDKIVCAGYASLFQELLSHLGIPCAYVHLQGKDGKIGHAGCAVYIEDEKYGMKNVAFSDPTFGSRSKEYPKDFQYMAMPKEVAERVWQEFGIDFKEIRKELVGKAFEVEKQRSQFDVAESYQKLFENDMEKNKFDSIVAIDALVKVFQSQGLSLDAASTIAGARFWGKSVQQIVENRKAIGNSDEKTEQELVNFARNKKDHSKRDTQKIEEQNNTGGLSRI